MKRAIIAALTCLSLATPSLQTAFAQDSEGQFIETTLCASGQLIRIPLGNEEDEGPAPMQACHALCSRDSDDDSSSGPIIG